ncbi:acyltransferase family protein [Reichenbachiella agarivorans]|uniref:Acyltransferase family protein n=1 Tax=Reichenbachiella agarivorans TaxID=2979464 RepID=A0ABY6CSA0_9BACT|nr:acyltransferase family protein [Reichenbachiella agarivorans]UXP32318.1 acyltransferase family protein [Reichenbachiella agarivorans]
MLHNRRYDIDWLRVIAIGLLLIYHIAIGFQPWGVFIQFIQNDENLTWIWTPMAMLNVWRIPLLFFVSGMGVYFAIQRRDWKSLLLERSKRILVPYVFGMIAIVPLHVFLWQNYYNQNMDYVSSPGHLWFLGNIYAYVLLFFPLFFYLKRHPEGKFHQFLKKWLGHPAGLLILMLPFIAEAELVNPESFEFYAMNTHGFWLGMVAFLTGFLCVYSGQAFWDNVTKWRWLLFAIAATLYIFRLTEGQFNAPYYLKAIESNLWIFTVFGFGYKYLNKPSSTLTYLSQAAYPIYITHMVFLYLASWFIFPLEIAPLLKLMLVIVFTFIGCFVTYEYVVRRVKWVRTLFGLK